MLLSSLNSFKTNNNTLYNFIYHCTTTSQYYHTTPRICQCSVVNCFTFGVDARIHERSQGQVKDDKQGQYALVNREGIGVSFQQVTAPENNTTVLQILHLLTGEHFNTNSNYFLVLYHEQRTVLYEQLEESTQV